MTDKEFWELLNMEPSEIIAQEPSTSEWDELVQKRPTPAPSIPAPSPKTRNNASATKIAAIVLAIILLVGSLGLTAYNNHKTNEATAKANSIILSASNEANEIVEKASEEASSRIADANAKAEEIKEDIA